MDYKDPAFGDISVHLEAWSPKIPLDPEPSAMPVIYFDFTVTNLSQSSAEVFIFIGVIFYLLEVTKVYLLKVESHKELIHTCEEFSFPAFCRSVQKQFVTSTAQQFYFPTM